MLDELQVRVDDHYLLAGLDEFIEQVVVLPLLGHRHGGLYLPP